MTQETESRPPPADDGPTGDRTANRHEAGPMNIVDLAKATVVCGGIGALVYRFPLFGQVVLITVLTLLWLSYARATLHWHRRR